MSPTEAGIGAVRLYLSVTSLSCVARWIRPTLRRSSPTRLTPTAIAVSKTSESSSRSLAPVAVVWDEDIHGDPDLADGVPVPIDASRDHLVELAA